MGKACYSRPRLLFVGRLFGWHAGSPTVTVCHILHHGMCAYSTGCCLPIWAALYLHVRNMYHRSMLNVMAYWLYGNLR